MTECRNERPRNALRLEPWQLTQAGQQVPQTALFWVRITKKHFSPNKTGKGVLDYGQIDNPVFIDDGPGNIQL